jgi:hypothetical protein
LRDLPKDLLSRLVFRRLGNAAHREDDLARAAVIDEDV